jgi:hypothetical protein
MHIYLHVSAGVKKKPVLQAGTRSSSFIDRPSSEAALLTRPPPTQVASRVDRRPWKWMDRLSVPSFQLTTVDVGRDS